MQDRLVALSFLVMGVGIVAAGGWLALEVKDQAERELRVVGVVLLTAGVSCAALGVVLWSRACGRSRTEGDISEAMTEKMSGDAAPKPTPAVAGLGEDLYGRLLELEARLGRANGVFFPCFVLLLSSYAALWFGWYRIVPGLEGLELRGIMPYALVLGALYMLWVVGYLVVRRRLYRRERCGLIAQVRAAGVGRYRLLALIECDASVQVIAAELKLDRWEDAPGTSVHEKGSS